MTLHEFLMKRTNLEKKHLKATLCLDWDYTDVLYSFLGVYVIGLNSFYPDDFISKGITVRPKNNEKQDAYSNRFFKNNFEKYEELNKVLENSGFLESYFLLGNIVPIWPGGNTHKGQSKCFDIPDLYFKKSKIIKCSENFFNINNLNACLSSLFASEYYLNKETSDFLKFSKHDYQNFLSHIVMVINDREKRLQEILETTQI